MPGIKKNLKELDILLEKHFQEEQKKIEQGYKKEMIAIPGMGMFTKWIKRDGDKA